LIADQARTIPPEIGRAVAGVNGDFYERENPTYAGDPRGLQIVKGELISAQARFRSGSMPRGIRILMK